MEKVKGFAYRKAKYRYIVHFIDGEWNEGYMSDNENIILNESACVLQYAQTAFEGLKAYKTKDGRIVCFRPDLNAERLQDSCKRMKIPTFPKERFLDAIIKVIKANIDEIPPYEDGGSLYIRPYAFGSTPVLGVKSADEFELRIFASPVGSYFGNDEKTKPLFLRISDLDRAAPHGTGNVKVGLNYAMSLYNIMEAHELGYDENVYLDSATRTYIEETGGANIVFVDKDDKLVIPMSNTILPSITRRSLSFIASKLGYEVEERKVRLDEISSFKECGLCGTAAVISPVGKIDDHGTIIEYKVEENGYGKVLSALKDYLVKIKRGDEEAPEGWIVEVK